MLVVDAGQPRNATVGHVHNYLGGDGTPPEELLTIGRAEARPRSATDPQGQDVTIRDTVLVARKLR